MNQIEVRKTISTFGELPGKDVQPKKGCGQTVFIKDAIPQQTEEQRRARDEFVKNMNA